MTDSQGDLQQVIENVQRLGEVVAGGLEAVGKLAQEIVDNTLTPLATWWAQADAETKAKVAQECGLDAAAGLDRLVFWDLSNRAQT